MATCKVACPHCKKNDVSKMGFTSDKKQRYLCKNIDCNRTFITNYDRLGWLPGTEEKIIDMAMNASGIRDTARVLGICQAKVIETFKKKEACLNEVNHALLNSLKSPEKIEVKLERTIESEADEMWSFVGKKADQRWLWHAIDHESGKILAYVLDARKDRAFLRLKALLEPFGITKYYTDDWGAYARHLPEKVHEVGKRNTQKIERKHLTLRTRIKRLTRKTICFSKLEKMHDIIIGLFINRYEFGVCV